jgi:hypothetical protein
MSTNVASASDECPASKPKSACLGLLAGGGEMGERTRSFDWAGSTVGPVEGWPHSLKTAVSICLGSRHPMVVWWDRRANTQFYNDAYISFLGHAKHPMYLGRPARECWSEIWPIIEPMLEGTRRGRRRGPKTYSSCSIVTYLERKGTSRSLIARSARMTEASEESSARATRPLPASSASGGCELCGI